MLSSQEIEDIHHELTRIEKSQKPKRLQNRKQHLQKQLKEHHFATAYAPFIPLPHRIYFINRKTSSETLERLIHATESCMDIMIDTESKNVKYQANQPALIQIQLVIPCQISIVIIVELFHLPLSNHPIFQLTQRLFEAIFDLNKRIYIWGTNTELNPFTESNLFSRNQINELNYCNLQADFRRYWMHHHPHQSNDQCQCEDCLNHRQNHTWGLQEAVGRELNRYLAKLCTCSDFHMGLDPQLNIHSNDQGEHRTKLIDYSIYDVLSMEQLVNEMKAKKFRFQFQSTTSEPNYMFDSSSDSDGEIHAVLTSNLFQSKPSARSTRTIITEEPTTRTIITEEPTTRTIIVEEPTTTRTTIAEESTTTTITEQSTTNAFEPTQPMEIELPPKPENPLSKAERIKIHNRSRSLHQRTNSYKTEFTIHDIDARFPISKMKKILIQYGIPITRVHPTQSKRAPETILFVGLKEPISSEQYDRVKNLFNREHYRRTFPQKPNQRRTNHRSTRANYLTQPNRRNRQDYRRK